MPTLRTVVVEDERLARRKLVMLLSTEPGIELVGDTGNAEEAVNLLRAERPDLVFLDIQLPGMDGFEVLQHAGLENVGHVVVVTAHDRYALRAFDVAAIDYGSGRRWRGCRVAGRRICTGGSWRWRSGWGPARSASIGW